MASSKEDMREERKRGRVYTKRCGWINGRKHTSLELLIGKHLLTTLPAGDTLLLGLPCLGRGHLLLLLDFDDLVTHGIELVLLVILLAVADKEGEIGSVYIQCMRYPRRVSLVLTF